MALSAANVQYSIPDEFQQAKLAKMIHGLVTNRYANHLRQELIEVVEQLDRQGTRTILLACTDLQALVPHHPRMQIFDTMQILADLTVSEMCEVDTEWHRTNSFS
ncbi:MAG: aspartate/glutamate racemase family protein [Bdellovibrionales bacterium]|nr:aspartate/glutamate racemase family protein [Bdellovibrionales bacterium]